MKVTCEPITIRLPGAQGLRSKGIHQSRIIKLMAKEAGVLRTDDPVEDWSLIEPGDLSSISDPEVLLRISLGLAWEEWYIRTQMPHCIDHPDEFEFEGIYMSMDAEEMAIVIHNKIKQLRHVIHEVKLTYKSVRTVGMLNTVEELKKNWLWLAQLKNYCKGQGTRFACLHVMFVCGNYKPAFKPQLRKFCIEFEQQEIEEHWELTKDYVLEKLEVIR